MSSDEVDKRKISKNAYETLECFCSDALREAKPISVEHLAEGVGLYTDYQYLTKEGKGVLGIIVYSETLTEYYDKDDNGYGFMNTEAGSLLIEYDLYESGHLEEYRSAIACGIAHWILHKEDMTKSGISKTVMEAKDNCKEQEIEFFASALLMPESSVKRRYDEIAKTETKNEKIIDILAKLFIVNRTAMRKALEDYGLI